MTQVTISSLLTPINTEMAALSSSKYRIVGKLQNTSTRSESLTHYRNILIEMCFDIVICNLKRMQIVLELDLYLSDRGVVSDGSEFHNEISLRERLGWGATRQTELSESWQWDRQNQHFHQLRIRKSDCYLTLRILEICTISWNIKKLISFTHNNIPPAKQPVFELIIQIFIAFNS